MGKQLLRFGWVGFHEEGIPALNWLLSSNYKIVTVITLDEKSARVRSAVGDYSSVCGNYGITPFRIDNINSQEAVRHLEHMDLDLVFVIGWSQIIHKKALSTSRLGMIGAHASLLPHNRGSAPINWAIINGEKKTGNTLIRLSEDVDTGEIIDQIEFPIKPYDSCKTLYEKVAETNREMIARTIPRIVAGERLGQNQSLIAEPVLPRRRPKDGDIDWSKSADRIYDFVRALTRPYPGARGYLESQMWLIWKCSFLPNAVTAEAAMAGECIGPLISFDAGACGQVVKCGDGMVVLNEVEDRSGRLYSGIDLCNLNWQGRRWKNE